ncbi:hypothetical protein HaLaN_23041 [Haematococcus lacustris]|uniref:Uncharacterized protein n=1 Tax=Haematococcus lacustris TaxID=44745 RepID=A0A6A0A1M9_HAELA|nr:hypothetical protein HaLaN_23041 [Haematococcus lacustris]
MAASTVVTKWPAQILYQNASSLRYAGSPHSRAAAARGLTASPPGVTLSANFLADLLQLQPEVLEELLETVVVGAELADAIAGCGPGQRQKTQPVAT